MRAKEQKIEHDKRELELKRKEAAKEADADVRAEQQRKIDEMAKKYEDDVALLESARDELAEERTDLLQTNKRLLDQ